MSCLLIYSLFPCLSNFVVSLLVFCFFFYFLYCFICTLVLFLDCFNVSYVLSSFPALVIHPFPVWVCFFSRCFTVRFLSDSVLYTFFCLFWHYPGRSQWSMNSHKAEISSPFPLVLLHQVMYSSLLTPIPAIRLNSQTWGLRLQF